MNGEYSAKGEQEVLTPVTVSERDGYGNKIWQASVSGAVTSQVLARHGVGAWTLTVTNADGTKTVQTYAGGRLATSQTLDMSNQQVTGQSYSYDGLGRLVGQSDARTGVVTMTYDALDRPLTVTTNNGQDTTVSEYDARGNVIKRTLPGGSETFSVYNMRGKLIATHWVES
jgi:YD repeat-containing protein